MNILVIEDEEAIRNGLVDVFVYHGYTVQACDNGPDGLALALGGRFDLVLLDIMLPGLDGYGVCDQIRQQNRLQPIIMLTAKNSDEEIIKGLKLGADDYVAKPFSVTQLVLRVEAVLRRSKVADMRAACIVLRPGGEDTSITVDTENLSASSAQGEIIFTRREMDILKYLAANTTRPVPREELLAQVWGYSRELEIETRTVDIHIAKLRRKIEPDSKTPVCLVTVRGAGYRLKVVG